MAEPSPARRRLLLLLCGLILLALRWPSYHEPPERDIATYAVIGRELNLGRTLYDDLWDHKPPPVYVAYALANRIAGEGPLELLLIWLVAASACVTGIHRAARRLGGEEAGSWAAVLLSLTSADLWLQANQANTELLVNAAMAWGVALLPGLEDTGERSPLARTAASGLLLGLAVLTKPVALFPAGGVCLALAGLRIHRLGRRAFPELGLLAVGAVLPGALTLGFFALTSRWRPFVHAVISYNSWYASDLVANLGRGLQPPLLLPPTASPLLLLLIPAVLVLPARRRRAAWWIAGAWLAGVPLAVAAPGRFYAHYYQLWLPVLALLGGLGMASLPAPARWRRLLGGALLAAVAAGQAPSLVLPARQWSRAKYGSIFVDAEQTAALVSRLTPPGSWIFVWGDEPEISWLTHCRPSSGVLWALHMTSGPLAEELSRRAVRDLERHPPELVVVHRQALGTRLRRHPVLSWVLQRYRPAPLQPAAPAFRVLLPVGTPGAGSPGDPHRRGTVPGVGDG